MTKKRRLTKRRLIHAAVIVGTGSFFAIALLVIQPFYTFNQWFADQFIESEIPTSNVVIVGIDDSTLEKYGKWSEWPRSLHANAVENLSDAGATAIGYDIIFANISPQDDVFTAAIGKAGNVVLAAAGTGIPTTTEKGLSFDSYLYPTQQLNQASGYLGHVDMIPDADGKVRRIPLVIRGEDGNHIPTLGLAVMYALFHQSLPESYQIHNGTIDALARSIPVDNTYFMRLNFAIKSGSIPIISYGDIISGNFDPNSVKNKIVLVGMTATGDIDTFAIPNSSIRVPGVMLHAATIDTILRGSFLAETGIGVTLLIMALIVATCAIALPLFGTWYWTDILKGIGLITGLLLLFLVFSSLSASRGYIISVLYPVLILATISAGNTIFIAVREQSDKGFVKNLFGRYVSPDVSKQIVSLASEGRLKLGGEEREVTVLFADIRNFTQMSEGMSPENVVSMLNKCLPVVIQSIVDNGGMVNKFAGDNIMGVWNAPRSMPDHAVMAVKAAWTAQQQITGLAIDIPNCGCVQFGIGLNTGRAIAGNLGSIGRAEYTVIGDTVNLASRICSITPGGQVYIGPETYSLIKNLVEVEELGPQTFKGKGKPVEVYRVKAWK